ncbi:hypothetical protein MRX96_025278 [Rhipicephalus microplus]
METQAGYRWQSGGPKRRNSTVSSSDPTTSRCNHSVRAKRSPQLSNTEFPTTRLWRRGRTGANRIVFVGIAPPSSKRRK